MEEAKAIQSIDKITINTDKSYGTFNMKPI